MPHCHLWDRAFRDFACLVHPPEDSAFEIDAAISQSSNGGHGTPLPIAFIAEGEDGTPPEKRQVPPRAWLDLVFDSGKQFACEINPSRRSAAIFAALGKHPDS
jgi:hypothetical protein